jgi:hypothetical protein
LKLTVIGLSASYIVIMILPSAVNFSILYYSASQMRNIIKGTTGNTFWNH